MPDRTESESPAAPPMPSFASLRDPRRRTVVDVLMSAPAESPAPAWASAPPTGRPAATGPRPAATGPRPAEYADLLRFGLRALRSTVVLPARAVRWTVREPVRCLRRFAG